MLKKHKKNDINSLSINSRNGLSKGKESEKRINKIYTKN